MKTTITEYIPTHCPRCMGSGRISCFQHFKAGECFRCGGTGKGQPVAIDREMTDDEVLSALADKGVSVMFNSRPDSGDWLVDLFGTEDDRAERAQTMVGARMMLRAL